MFDGGTSILLPNDVWSALEHFKKVSCSRRSIAAVLLRTLGYAFDAPETMLCREGAARAVANRRCKFLAAVW